MGSGKAYMDNQILKIEPVHKPLNATVEIPGSKSITNRALLIAALAEGRSVLRNVLFSDDSHYFMRCLQTIGYQLEIDETSRTVAVTGTGGQIPKHEGLLELFVGNAGTAARFLTAFVSLAEQGSFRIDGIPRMRQRPIQDLIDALQTLGVRIESEQQTGCPPVRIEAKGLQGGRVSIPGNKSSQYLSAILLTAPYAKNPVDIEVSGELLSAPYIDMTKRMMEQFGVHVERTGNASYRVSNQMYQRREYIIEPDASGASYFLAAPAIAGGKVKITNLTQNSLQGDAKFAGLLEQMGCTVRWGADFIEVEKKDGQVLTGIDVDLNEMSDTTMTLAAVAPFASSPTTIRNIGHIRIKETDRIHAVVTELRKLGVTVEEWEDGMRIEPAKQLTPAAIDTYDDHRMAMAFSLFGLTIEGLEIKDPGCVSKTFPNFFDVFADMCKQ
ncbi:3-phosphoshikimate 1-carboxyvinyltransferase [Effusibacillus dendaii]|uniref:3-phosphoshikimate 1-carboxyvinyltransferase n=1 Tax=Effusibacillus dendaii TaxID=2743772 RepID=A0A7I8D5N7_9BACL|nr:3-phosphoshikimate 1-carboxyvinyltransferase [Effusibacillus dendaii]BCJ85405.1 3-phosphoshikimate 1-carboxyvinyltransferase [Effusibacillus dendaii]